MTGPHLAQVGRILLITLLLMVAMTATMASLLWSEWVEQRSMGIRKAREETIAVAAGVGAMLERTDLLLTIAGDHVLEADPKTDHGEAHEDGSQRSDADHIAGRLPETGRLLMADARGQPQALKSWPGDERLPPDLVALHAEAGQSFAISRDTSNPRPALVVSRRLDRPDGGFGGVLAAAFDADMILGTKVYPDMSLTIASLLGGHGGGDGRTLVTWRRVANAQGTLPTPPPSNGSWVDVTLERIVASEPIPGFPVRVVTSLPRDPYLRLWWALMARIGGVFVVVTALVVFGVLSVIREIGCRTAAEAELTVANAELRRLMAEVETLARVDALTGIANRRSFDERLASELSRVQRSGGPLSLIIVDLDHFKRINDRYGHTMGDRVLATSAAVLREGVREVDFPARYGGEEFVVLLPNTALDGALLLAGRLCAALDQPHHGLEDGSRITVTASMGVAQHDPGETATQFLARADAALYKSKSQGRNRVSCAGAWRPSTADQGVEADA